MAGHRPQFPTLPTLRLIVDMLEFLRGRGEVLGGQIMDHFYRVEAVRKARICSVRLVAVNSGLIGKRTVPFGGSYCYYWITPPGEQFLATADRLGPFAAWAQLRGNG